MVGIPCVTYLFREDPFQSQQALAAESTSALSAAIVFHFSLLQQAYSFYAIVTISQHPCKAKS
jgi:hypothetical protein